MALPDAGASSISVTGMRAFSSNDSLANRHKFVCDPSQFEKLHNCRLSLHPAENNTLTIQNKMR
jgi:hypothetical protein